MKRWVVLGGGGFIGTNLCLALTQRGLQVTSFGGRFLYQVPGVQYTVGDAADEKQVAEVLRSADCVVNLAHGSTPASAEGDILGALHRAAEISSNVIKNCVNEGVRLVFASSGGTVYGRSEKAEIEESDPTNPISVYGISKLLSEMLHYKYGIYSNLNYIALRIGNPYGPWQFGSRGFGFIPAAIQAVLKEQQITIFGDKFAVRDYIYIGDLCEAVIAAGSYDGPERCMNIGGGSGGATVVSVIKQIEELTSRRARVVLSAGRGFDVPRNVLSIELAKRSLGWQPQTSLRDGMWNTLKWTVEQDGK